MNVIKHTGLGLALVIGTMLLSANTVYQWTDENGVVHFSQTAPDDKSQSVVETNLRSAPKTGGTFAPPPTAEPEQETESTDNDPAEGQQEYTYTKNAENCARAREMLSTLDTGRKLRLSDPETGEIIYATEEDLDEQRLRANAAIERDC